MIVIGGGLSGLAAACVLAEAGLQVTLYEKSPSLGGRARSLTPEGAPVPVDNCQHITMRCCTNFLDFCARLGVTRHLRFHDTIRFLDAQGRESALRGACLPAPLHLLPSFAGLRFLGARDKLGIARAFSAMLRERDPGDRPFADWLAEHRQTPRALEAFWRPVLVSALNEDERVSARYAFQAFRDGFLRGQHAYEVGIPTLPLGELYCPPASAYLARYGARVVTGAAVTEILLREDAVRGVRLAEGLTVAADAVVAAVPFPHLPRLLPPEVAAASPFRQARQLRAAPIAGISLWFDRPVAPHDYISLVDSPIHWVFRKRISLGGEEGALLSLVVSASREWARCSREEIRDRALAEVRRAFPEARGAHLLGWQVTKEPLATFSPLPGSDALRPAQETPVRGLFLAGDWTRTGWPATMEGAVRSGYLAAEALLARAGRPRRVLVPDLPPSPLARLLG